MIARQIMEMWTLCGEEQFTIVEYGAGTGLLCYDILGYFKSYPHLYKNLQYCIIEKSPFLRERQKKYLKEKVCWYNSIHEMKPLTGCIVSNELVDNFPVHQVVMEEELMEIFIDYKDDFYEVYRPANEKLKEYLSALGVQLPRSFRTEINLEAIEWIREISSALKKGYIITIDYGNVTTELYSARKSCGTLVCYNKHSVNDRLYNDIGKQDITSHVNFSALVHWGTTLGLDCCGLTDQANFLLALGFKDYLRQNAIQGQDLMSMVKKESFLTHMLLVEMGSKFKVLIQKKGIPAHPLSGLKFC
jgi:SAM-dependent MidA family methyltransferase